MPATGEGWTGLPGGGGKHLPGGPSGIAVSSCLPFSWAKQATRGTSPGTSEAKQAAGLSLPVNASLQICLSLLALAAQQLLLKLQALELDRLGSDQLYNQG